MKLSPAQSRLMEQLERSPMEIEAKTIGYGWRMPLGVEMRTIDALRRMALIKTKIAGAGATRRMLVTKS